MIYDIFGYSLIAVGTIATPLLIVWNERRKK